MTTDSGGRGIWEYDIVKYSVVLSLLLFGGLIVAYGFTEEGVRQLIRWSARISFSLFCLVFSASAIHYFSKNSLSWWLRMNRKYFGISFAIIHLIHLAFIIILQLSFYPVFEGAASISLVGGSVAYFFVVTMLVTSFDSIKSKVSISTWKLIHTIGGYWIWAVFLSTYYKRTDEPWHWIYVMILVFVLILRLSLIMSKRTKKGIS